MSDQKGRPLNADELSKVSDIVTDSKSAGAQKSEETAPEKQAVAEPPAKAKKKSDKRFGIFGILSVLFGGLWRVFRIFILIGVIIGSLLSVLRSLLILFSFKSICIRLDIS